MKSVPIVIGVCKDAVLKLIRDMGAACSEFHNSAVRGVKVQRVQCDEVWSFCYAKEKNVPETMKEGGAGSVWTWIAIDADSKLVLSYLCGGRDASWACRFMEDLASRVTTRIQITTDGHRAYAEAVEGAFGIRLLGFGETASPLQSPSGPPTFPSPREPLRLESPICSDDTNLCPG